jgi:hypothetical protein
MRVPGGFGVGYKHTGPFGKGVIQDNLKKLLISDRMVENLEKNYPS